MMSHQNGAPSNRSVSCIDTNEISESQGQIEESEDEINNDDISAHSTSSLNLNESEYEHDSNRPDFTISLESLQRSVGLKPLNKTFSDARIRDIEHNNFILMKKIMSNNRRNSLYTRTPKIEKVSNSAVNRKKQQRQIEHDNLILLRKIQKVKPTDLSCAKK